MQIAFGGFSHIGNTRPTNQDSLLIKNMRLGEKNICIGAVCDGVGGLEDGELASVTAVLTLRSWFDQAIAEGAKDYEYYRTGLYRCIYDINSTITRYAGRMGIRTGTTVSSMLIYENRFFIAHIGDSRIYKAVGELYQLTQDHVVAQTRVSGGCVTEKRLLTQCVGYQNELDIFCADGWLEKGDAYLLCSDGFYERMGQAEVLRALRKAGAKSDLDSLAQKLAKDVMKRQERDNISLGIIKIF